MPCHADSVVWSGFGAVLALLPDMKKLADVQMAFF